MPQQLGQPSRVIPIECPKDDDDDNPPPEWAMIELNGDVIAPTEFPTHETCQSVLCGGDRVELGRLQLSSDNKVNNNNLKSEREYGARCVFFQSRRLLTIPLFFHAYLLTILYYIIL
jgi:hypothetical protein